jgi:hypothetical protein
MKAVQRRLTQLEAKLRPPDGPDLLIVGQAGRLLALDKHACVEILREGGFIPATTGFLAVKLNKVPHGLDALS